MPIAAISPLSCSTAMTPSSAWRPTATVAGNLQGLGLRKLGECQLRLGDTLALYTDGITESYKLRRRAIRAKQRLIEALQRHREASSQAALASIVD